MKKATKFFGEIEVQDKDVIRFEDGIPGFMDLHEFILINDQETDFVYLQSAEKQQVCFIMLPPALIVGNYDIDISEETVEKLKIKDPADVMLYSILTIPQDFKKMTANLKAPVVINLRNNKGRQEILDTEYYAVRHQVIKEADAC